MAGMGVMHPAMQVAPNLMSFQHQAPQMLTNPYMGGPFSQLPFSQPSRTLPFQAPAYGAPAYPAATGMPGVWPFAGAAAATPAAPMNPYLMPALPPAPAKTSALPFNPLDLFKPAPPVPAPAPAPQAATGWPFMMPAAAPAAPVAAPMSAPSLPFAAPWQNAAPTTPVVSGPTPVGAPAKPAAPAAPVAPVVAPAQSAGAAVAPATAAAQNNPFDPAYWLAPLKAAPTN